jgi:hypothetical protein
MAVKKNTRSISPKQYKKRHGNNLKNTKTYTALGVRPRKGGVTK